MAAADLERGDGDARTEKDNEEGDQKIPSHTLILCGSILALHLFQSIAPAESYLHEYLQTYKHIDKDQMPHNIWPMYTYAHFAALIPVTIAAERYVHYPPIIVFSIVLRLITSVIHDMTPDTLIWPHQLSFALFGVACAGKVAFRSFTYSVLPTRIYFAMTSYMRGFNSAAHVLGGCLGWALKRASVEWFVFFRIQQACLLTALFSFLVGLYISYMTLKNNKSLGGASPVSIFCHDQVRTARELWQLIRSLYSSRALVVYSVWFIVASAVFEVAIMNETTLFHRVDPSAKENGVVFGVAKFVAAIITICLSRYSNMMERNGLRILTAMSCVSSAALITSYLATNITMAYMALIFTCISFDICYCISMTLVASSVPTSVRGIIIFCNTVLSLGIQTGIQGCLRLLEFDVFHYYFSLGIIFSLATAFLFIGQYGISRRPMSSVQKSIQHNSLEQCQSVQNVHQTN